MLNVIFSFWDGLTAPSFAADKEHCHHERKMRNRVTEEQLDRMLAESCDASDPIATY